MSLRRALCLITSRSANATSIVTLGAAEVSARCLAGVRANVHQVFPRRPHLLSFAALSVATLAAGCHGTPAATPLAQLNAQQTEGYNDFQVHCALCHNERIDQAKNGPSLAGVFKKPSLPSGAPANDERVTATILHGHGLMPAQPNLDPETLADLLAYLHTV